MKAAYLIFILFLFSSIADGCDNHYGFYHDPDFSRIEEVSFAPSSSRTKEATLVILLSHSSDGSVKKSGTVFQYVHDHNPTFFINSLSIDKLYSDLKRFVEFARAHKIRIQELLIVGHGSGSNKTDFSLYIGDDEFRFSRQGLAKAQNPLNNPFIMLKSLWREDSHIHLLSCQSMNFDSLERAKLVKSFFGMQSGSLFAHHSNISSRRDYLPFLDEKNHPRISLLEEELLENLRTKESVELIDKSLFSAIMSSFIMAPITLIMTSTREGGVSLYAPLSAMWIALAVLIKYGASQIDIIPQEVVFTFHSETDGSYFYFNEGQLSFFTKANGIDVFRDKFSRKCAFSGNH